MDHKTEAELSKYTADAVADIQNGISKEPAGVDFGKRSVCVYTKSNSEDHPQAKDPHVIVPW